MTPINLFNDGFLIDVNVSFWSAAKKLTEEDMGLDEVSDAYTLGKKYLIPREVIAAFRHVENKARHLVEKNSFKFPVGNAHFVPRRKLLKIHNELKACQAEYNALVESLVLKYQEYREQMRPVYIEAAEKAYMNRKPETETFGPDRDIVAEKQTFIDTFMARIEALYPPVSTLKQRFSLDWSPYEIAMPRHQRDANEVAEDLELRQQIELDYRNQMHEKIGTFVQDVVGVLRQETTEICGNIVASITEGKVIRGVTIDKLRNFIDGFQDMNFVGDTTIENQLNAVRTELLNAHTNDDFVQDKELQATLKEQLGKIVEQAKDTSDINTVTGQYRRKIEWE